MQKVSAAHDKTCMFCTDEHSAAEIDARGILYAIEHICFVRKKVCSKTEKMIKTSTAQHNECTFGGQAFTAHTK